MPNRERRLDMASERQLAANRNNARRSTGPCSSAGKRRASQNARQHGFAAACFRAGDPKQVEILARQIAAEAINPLILEKARRAAQATFDLAQIRRAKVELIASQAAEFTKTPLLRPVDAAQPSEPEAPTARRSESRRGLLKFDRYEKACHCPPGPKNCAQS